MKYKSLIATLLCTLMMSGCVDWIYRIDVPQGNFLEQKNVDKLRIKMTKEQVIYVLGKPVVQDAFNDDTWYYLYDMKRGMSKNGEDIRKELVITFENDRITSVTGDFELSEEFNIPLDE